MSKAPSSYDEELSVSTAYASYVELLVSIVVISPLSTRPLNVNAGTLQIFEEN